MPAYWKGFEITGPRGSSGPDGNPIGTIISYMGLTAPKDYLICDGSVYNISDYYSLAKFFKEQYGSESYFGGNGTTTFAVPDMRNLFLRGFHGEASEQLSGDIGIKQDATENTYMNLNNNTIRFKTGQVNFEPKNTDSISGGPAYGATVVAQPNNSSSVYSPFYTSRPVNMAVLYCIKATVAETYENVYSTEETHIGTWIDGKSLYRKVINTTTPSTVNVGTNIYNIGNIYLCKAFGSIDRPDTGEYILIGEAVQLNHMNGYIRMSVFRDFLCNRPVTIILEYTKTTD